MLKRTELNLSESEVCGALKHSVFRKRSRASAQPEGALKKLHMTVGNQAVQRLAESVKRSDDDLIDLSVNNEINALRGGGQPLDSAVKNRMGRVFETDFSNVRVHTGPRADFLSRSLNARAFTTGRDIFFRDGDYSPSSSSGRELLAHELTHVVQQDDSIRARLVLGQAEDEFEAEADNVAREVMRLEDTDSSDCLMRQQEEDEETDNRF